MSLTTLLKQPEIRAAFKELTDKPKTPTATEGVNGEIKAKPITKHYSLIGTSFDYLMRFYLERHNTGCITKRWVANHSINRLMREKGDSEIDIKAKMLLKRVDYEENPPHMKYEGDRYTFDIGDTVSAGVNSYLYAECAYNRYIETGVLDDPIFIASILLGRLDYIFRAGFIDPDIGMVLKDDIQDLKNLICVIPEKEFISKDKCLLNPVFGSGSELVGGADADFIIDNTLIDIKTTQSRTITRESFNQIVGYYVLSKYDNLYDIEKVSIYFSRFGIKYTYNVNEIINEKNIKQLKDIISTTIPF